VNRRGWTVSRTGFIVYSDQEGLNNEVERVNNEQEELNREE
jgi:hypothetical protein